MMTGMVTGYNRIGNMISRARERTSIAAKSVPTEAKPTVPVTSSAARSSGKSKKRRLEQECHHRHENRLERQHQQHHAEQLPDVDGRPGRWRQQQRLERLAVSLALERAPERELARVDHREPQNAGRGAVDWLAFHDERDREDQHGRHREEQGREHNLAVASLDGDVLLQDEERDS